jgi:hypothetical protein
VLPFSKHPHKHIRFHREFRKSPALISISTCSRHEEVNLVSFANILSTILSAPDKTPDPVREQALDVAKSEVIP